MKEFLLVTPLLARPIGFISKPLKTIEETMHVDFSDTNASFSVLKDDYADIPSIEAIQVVTNLEAA